MQGIGQALGAPTAKLHEPGYLEQLTKQLESLKALRGKLSQFNDHLNGNNAVGDQSAKEPHPAGIYGLIGEIQTNVTACHNLLDDLSSRF